ncbi:MAG: FHA domain-containing protein [Boseongicola sp.]|nr:FHA domain-containing protein [Boseongicola sp.]
MKLFKNIMSRKPDPEEAVGKIDLEMDVEPLRRRSDPLADDTGRVNSSRQTSDFNDPLFADRSKPSYEREEEPEEVDGAGWGATSWDDHDDWDDEDDDWGDDDGFDANGEDKTHLVNEIRGAVSSVSHVSPDEDHEDSATHTEFPSSRWSDDAEFGRKAIARSQLGSQIDGAEDRLMRETDSKFVDSESSRRRSAMAHLKAAAQATKADRVLKHVAERDPTADPEEQSPYRDDLAKVVRPRTSSRPISRPVSRPRSEPAAWDQGTSDEDAALFAASEESAFDGDSFENAADEDHDNLMAGAPADLSADDFADDSAFNDEPSAFAGSAFADDDDDEASDWGSRFASHDDEGIDRSEFSDEPVSEAAAEDASAMKNETFDADEDAGGFDMDESLDMDEIPEMDGPVASSVVSEVVASANEAEEEDEPVDDDFVRRQIAEMSGVSEAAAEVEPVSEADGYVNVAAAVSGRAGRSAGRVKTRLLGFQTTEDTQEDVFEAAKAASETNKSEFPVGWIIVISGPGRGSCFTMFTGVSQIGRGEDQAVRLDFGDTSISRNNHAAVAYDDEQGKFFLGHGGKSNLVRLNGKPVLSTEELVNGDMVRIGETTLKFVALCGEDFTWASTEDEGTAAE